MRYLITLIVAAVLGCNAVANSIALHSLPGSQNSLYIDCSSHPWNVPDSIVAAVWEYVARIYSAFDIDVTTVWPGERLNVAWVILGGPLGQHGEAGYAGLGNWIWGTKYGDGFAAHVFADGLGNQPDYVAICIAHETGHLAYLNHQSEGVMAPFLELKNDYWTIGVNSVGAVQDDVAVLGGQFGFAPVPEPTLIALLFVVLLKRKRA